MTDFLRKYGSTCQKDVGYGQSLAIVDYALLLHAGDIGGAMANIIKTWPAHMDRRRVLEAFNHDWGQFYFSIGRGKPKEEISEVWFTHHGEILGYFKVAVVVRNMGDNLPKLCSISGEESEWQIKLMNYVAICDPPFVRAPEKTYHDSFRGFRYFDFQKHLDSPYAKVKI